MSAGSVFAFLPPPLGEGRGGGTTASTQSQRSSGAAPISAFPRKGKEQEVRS
jgi:hypothetical protein